MSLEKEFKEIPGTIVFDAEQSRKGYHLNQFCMSLMKAGNRERFKADQRAYLDEWNLTDEAKDALLRRDYNTSMYPATRSGQCSSKVRISTTRVSIMKRSRSSKII